MFMFMIAEVIDFTKVFFGVAIAMFCRHVNGVCYLTYLDLVLHVREGKTLGNACKSMSEFIVVVDVVFGSCMRCAWFFYI